MKLLLSILDDRAAHRVADALIAQRFGVTRINTVGGFLRRGNATLLVGVEDERVDAAMELMRAAYGHEHRGDSAGPVFVLNTTSTERI